MILILNSLRCYEDSELGFYNTGLRDSCDYTYVWVSIQQSPTASDINVYPNPFETKLFIEARDNNYLNYEIFDLRGSLLKQGRETDIDLSNLQNGIYFLKATIKNRQCKMIKIIKHLP